MKKIINLKFIVILIFTLLFSEACNEWMELEPEDKLIRQEFWQKEDDVNAVVAAMYDAFRETSLSSLILGEVRADMVKFTGVKFRDYSRIAASDINPTNEAVKWEKYYFAINMANTLMQFMPDVLEKDDQFTETERLAYHAEALFIRSLSYFYLVRLWKEVPLILSASSSDTVDFYLPKSPEHVVLNQLIKDLEYAETIAYTTENKSDPVLFKGRANRYSIQTLLADIYLWMENYEKCIEYCDKIINSKLFSLQNEIDWFNIYYPGNSSEGIFEIQYGEVYKEVNPIYYDLIQVGGMKQVIPQPTLSDMFTPTDIRNCGNYNITWKYLGKSLLSYEMREQSERDANYIYYRYADVLLMKAEALAEIQNYSDAQELLNEIITRSGQVPSFFNESIQEFREAILLERAREFALEGKRWFDILRFAKKNGFANKSLIIDMILENTTVQLRPVLRSRVLDTMSYYLPIPESDLLYNKKLIQNPFYDK